VRRGDTFLGGREAHGQHHLWRIINQPSHHNNVALIVNVSTLCPGAETTCILAPGEQPFIKHPSYVRYSGAREVTVAQLTAALKKGLLKPHQPASTALLEKIRAGARVSPHLPAKLRALL